MCLLPSSEIIFHCTILVRQLEIIIYFHLCQPLPPYQTTIGMVPVFDQPIEVIEHSWYEWGKSSLQDGVYIVYAIEVQHSATKVSIPQISGSF